MERLERSRRRSPPWSPYAEVYDPLKAGSIDGTDVKPHDNGIVRAMNAHYEPDPDLKNDKERTVFVSRLNPGTVEDTIESEFSKYGKIKSLKLVRDIVTGFSKSYAFVEFEERRAAHRACRDGNKSVIDGKEIFVDAERQRTLKGWIPRRLGGGFGGRKESGQLRFGGRDRPFKKPISLLKRGDAELERYQHKPVSRSDFS